MKRFIKMISAVALGVILTAFGASTVKAEGWVAFPDGYYYMYDNGTFATNTTVGIFKVGPTGRVTYQEAIDQTNAILAQQAAAQAALAQQAAAQKAPAATAVALPKGDLATVCATIVASQTNPSMTTEQKIRALFNYMVNATEYKRTYETPVGNWGAAYALECLTTGKGNCYRYAAAFAYLLKAAGIEPRIAYGQIHAARGGLTPHSWTEINVNGTWITCDCEMQDAKKGKYNFFMLPFEQYPIKPLTPQGYLPASF